MYRHCSASPCRGTCLRFSAAGAARSRSPLSPRHLTTPFGRVRSRFRALSSFHSHALRHLPPLCFGRSRSQPSASTQAICHRDLSSSPLGGCRCALCRRNNCSVLLPPLGGSYPAQPAADPGLLFVGAGNNSTPRCPLKIQLSAQIGAQNARHASLPAASSNLCSINPTFSPDFCYRFFISRRRLPADIQ